MVKRVDCDLSELNKLPELIREGADVFYHFGWDGTFGNSRNNMYGQNLNVKYALDAVEAAFALGCSLHWQVFYPLPLLLAVLPCSNLLT